MLLLIGYEIIKLKQLSKARLVKFISEQDISDMP